MIPKLYLVWLGVIMMRISFFFIPKGYVHTAIFYSGAGIEFGSIFTKTKSEETEPNKTQI